MVGWSDGRVVKALEGCGTFRGFVFADLYGVIISSWQLQHLD